MQNAKTTDVLEEVLLERERQDAKWGEQNHPDMPEDDDDDMWREPLYDMESAARRSVSCGPSWAAILAEEVGETFHAVTPELLRAELIQVAAVAVAWVEALDRRSGK